MFEKIKKLVGLCRGTESTENVSSVPADRPVVLTHVRPDADAFGSAIGLVIAINGVAWFAEADWANAPATIKALAELHLDRGLSGSLKFRYTYMQIGGDIVGNMPVYVTDCGEPSRVSAPEGLRYLGVPVVASYDHHCNAPIGAGTQYGSKEYVSASAVVAKYCQNRPQLADAFLWAGHLGDSARFSVGDVPRAVAEASDIHPTAADAALVNAAYSRISVGRARLLRHFWSSLVVDEKLGLAITKLYRLDFAQAGANKADYAGMPALLLDIDGVRVVAALCEDQEQPGLWRIAFRTRGTGKAQVLAKASGGDGHQDAAGGVVPPGEHPESWVMDLVNRLV